MRSHRVAPLIERATLLFALALATPTLGAQATVTTTPLPPMAMRYAAAVRGEAARITVIEPRGGWAPGVLAWTTRDSVGLHRRRQRDTVAIARSNIAQFEVHRGTRPSPGMTALGVVGGGLVGLIGGMLIGDAVACRGDRCDDALFDGYAGIIWGGVTGMAAGGFGGAMLGGQRRVPRWVPLPP